MQHPEGQFGEQLDEPALGEGDAVHGHAAEHRQGRPAQQFGVLLRQLGPLTSEHRRPRRQHRGGTSTDLLLGLGVEMAALPAPQRGGVPALHRTRRQTGEQLADALGRGGAFRVECRLGGDLHVPQAREQHVGQDRLFVGEMSVDGGTRDTRGRRDVVDAHTVVAALPEQLGRDRGQLALAVAGALVPAVHISHDVSPL